MEPSSDTDTRAAHRERLRGFCLHVVRSMGSQTPEPKFLTDVERIVESCSSLRALKTIAADLLELSQDLSGDQLEDLNTQLSSANLPTLTVMRSAAQRRLMELLSMKRITKEGDARFLLGLLSDTSPAGLSPAEREIAGRLVREYGR